MVQFRRMRIVDSNEERTLMEAHLKIAFATDDMQHVNQHFGSAKTFVIYAVDPDGHELIEVAEFGKLEQDGNEDKLTAKIGLLDGCAAVYCEAMGASAIRQVLAAGIQPVKVCRGRMIADLLEEMRNELRTGPSAWVAKAIARQAPPDTGKFAYMEAEGWSE